MPRHPGAQAIAALYSLDLQDALQIAEFRSVAADDLWLSPCQGRGTVALHFTWVRSDALMAPAVRTVEAALAPFEARPHWGKVFALPPDEVRAHYPRLPRFRALLERHYPNRTFGNAFLRRYV